jgi:hypothetical protein
MRLGKPGEGYSTYVCGVVWIMSEGRRVREWSEYEWKIRNELLMGYHGRHSKPGLRQTTPWLFIGIACS